MPKATTSTTVAKSAPRTTKANPMKAAASAAAGRAKQSLQPVNITYCDKMVVNVYNQQPAPFAPKQIASSAAKRISSGVASAKPATTKAIAAKPAAASAASSAYLPGGSRMLSSYSQPALSAPANQRQWMAHPVQHNVPAVRSQPMERYQPHTSAPFSSSSMRPHQASPYPVAGGGPYHGQQHMMHHQFGGAHPPPTMMVKEMVFRETYYFQK